mmetsp:Transcript_28506/g.55430  ORF Transcript_28506/g.55430 Transcript_28506/m.55430 type:complete len:92 (+) Transcript_28506:786-1061(+)
MELTVNAKTAGSNIHKGEKSTQMVSQVDPFSRIQDPPAMEHQDLLRQSGLHDNELSEQFRYLGSAPVRGRCSRHGLQLVDNKEIVGSHGII